MKKILFSFFMLLSTVVSIAQITASSKSHIYSGFKGIDKLVMFYGINSNTVISYTGTYSSINWYKFSAPTVSISNQSEISPDDATGYILEVDGRKTSIWVIDYKNYKPIFNSLIAENHPELQCNDLNLLFDANIPILKYTTPDNLTYTIDRKFSISYQTVKWNSTAWTSDNIFVSFTNPKNIINIVTAPLCDTRFTISGDQFATDLNLDTIPTFVSPLYSAVAVECHATTELTTRSEKNEGERPSEASLRSGSAPLDILFKSNANTPIANFYAWTIKKNNLVLVVRHDQDHRYTFNESGTYTVKEIAQNVYCSDSDSVTIKVSVSDIQVPNIFTPNGDGYNDEFRVGYKSIIKFQCWVYNRWGRQVYYWTDPQKGWDGTINGKPAAEGVYYYVIKAKGSDGVDHPRKGDINLLRGKTE